MRVVFLGKPSLEEGTRFYQVNTVEKVALVSHLELCLIRKFSLLAVGPGFTSTHFLPFLSNPESCVLCITCILLLYFIFILSVQNA